MSASIDERIVSMKFDNAQFKKGTEETVTALQQLKDGLNFEGMEKGIDSISAKMGVFGAVAFSAINKLVGSAMDMGRQLAGAVLDPLVEGGKKRALNIEQAKFQFQGLGMDVEQAMADALYAVQGTAFGLDEAAVAASQFGASGVQSGQQMQNALLGISGVAAMAGTSYSEMADVFTKVAGQGRVMGDDLNRLGARGINAAATLGKAMGKTESEIRDMVSKGQISFEQFADIMGQTFGPQAKKASETYTGALSNMRAALARIGAEFAASHFEDQRIVFNALTPAIDNVKKAITPLITLWNDINRVSAETKVAMLDALNFSEVEGELPPFFQALQRIFQYVADIAAPIREALSEVFPQTMPDKIKSMAAAFNELTKNLKLSENASKNIKMVATAVFSVFKFGLDIIVGVGKVLFTVIGIVIRLAGAIFSLITPIVTFVRSLIPVQEKTEDTRSAVSKFFDMLVGFLNFISGGLIDGLFKAGAAFDSWLNGGGPAKVIKNTIQLFKDLGATVAMVWNVLAKGDFTGNPFFAEDSKFVDVLFRIREAVIVVIGKIEEFFGIVSDAGQRAKNFWGGFGAVMAAVWGAMKPAFQAIGDGFKSFADGLSFETILAAINTGMLVAVGLAIKNFIGSFKNIVDSVGGIGESFTNALEGLTGVLEAMQMNLKAEALLKIAGAIGILALSLLLLSMIDPNALMQASITMGVIAAAVLGILVVMERMMSKSAEVSSWSDTLKGSFKGIADSVKNNLNASALVKSAAALLILSGAIAIMAFAITKLSELSWEELAKGLIGVSVAMGVLTGAALVMSKFENSILKSAAAMVVMAAAIAAMAGAVAIFGNLPMDVLIQGGIAATVTMGLLVGAAVMLEKFAPKMVLSAVGLMAMAAALNMLLIPITALGLLPMPVIAQGMLAVTLMLAALAIAANVLGQLGPKMAIAAVGLMAMAGAIGQLVLPIISLGSIDMGTLIQGLLAVAAAVTILVIAANAMNGAMAGAGAMIFMAGAILILSGAVLILGSMPLENMIQGLIGMAAAILILGVAGAVLTPIIPGMLGVAAAIAVLGVGLVLMAAAVVVFSIGLAALGPALMSVTAGLVIFAEQAGVVAAAVPAMLAVGAGLIVFGAGALVAGVGIAALGAGLMLLGVGLALIATIGPLGALALTAVITSMAKLTDYIPQMLLLTPTFLAFGAAVAVLGAGLVVLGAGALVTGVALAMLVPLGALVTAALTLLMASIEKAAAKAPKIVALGDALKPLGAAITKIGSAGASASAGILGVTLAFTALSAAALVVRASVAAMIASVASGIPMMSAATTAGAAAMQAFVRVCLESVTALRVGLTAAMPAVAASAAAMGRALTSSALSAVRSDYWAMASAGYDVGMAITQGMRNGIQNGSSMVQAAARSVARNALNASKKELGVASPSKEYYKIGNWMDEGMASGQLQNINKVESASETVGKAAMDSMRESLSGLKNAVASDMTMQPTITPVLDLSAIKQEAGNLGSMLSVPQLRLDSTRAAAASTQLSVDRVREDRYRPDDSDGPNQAASTTVVLNQYNSSPKALSPTEIYRNGQNLISRAKEEIAKK